MRIESSVTSVSWIPLDAVHGVTKLPFEIIGHYDLPPPDVLEDLEALRASDSFRFANELRAFIEVDEGRIVGWGHLGRGHIGVTKLRLGLKEVAVPAVPLPDLRPEPEVRQSSVRFVQTAGGRTGAPMPRRVKRKPFVQVAAPLAWTTLALTIRADGSSEFEVAGASSFPRHWIYDHTGSLAAKSGLIDFETWYREAFGEHSPWGGEDSPAIVMGVESALERELSRLIIGTGPPPEIARIPPGKTLVEQGGLGHDLFLLFDGIVAVEVDGRVVTEVGPGAILGEMALFEGGRRTASLRTVTPCRIVTVPSDQVDREALAEVARGRGLDVS